jgi:putative phosphoribosyl transferase
MTNRFRNRSDAGQQLAARLNHYANRPDVLVVGLPQGGVPVAFEVSQFLGVPLDTCLVRKLCLPGHKHKPVTFGAVDSKGDRILNYEVVEQLEISEKTIDRIADRELRELQRRERSYCNHRPTLGLGNRTVIVVDDGLATGSTMAAAVALLRQQQPKSLAIAVPVAPKEVCDQLRAEVDEVVCLSHPDPFYGIHLSYENYAPTTEEEVRQLLAQSSQFPEGG